MSGNTADVHLSRSLGLGDVVLYFVTACSSLQWVAIAAAAGPSSLVVWVIAGFAMFLPVSVCTVALAARYPDEGGMYVWSKRAFGPFAGFLTGWTYWTSNLPYFAGMLYFAAGSALWISGGGVHQLAASPAWFVGFAVLGLGFATVLNIYGLGVSKWLNNAGAIARCAALLLLAGLGAVAWRRDVHQCGLASAGPGAQRSHFLGFDRFCHDRARIGLVHGRGNPGSTTHGAARAPARGAADSRDLHRRHTGGAGVGAVAANERHVRRDGGGGPGRRPARARVVDASRRSVDRHHLPRQCGRLARLGGAHPVRRRTRPFLTQQFW